MTPTPLDPNIPAPVIATGPGGRAIPTTAADVEKAKIRGVSPTQSALIDQRLAFGEIRVRELLAQGYSPTDPFLRNAVMEGVGALDDWMVDALAKEMYSSDPVPAGKGAPPGVTAIGPDGKEVVFPYPAGWGTSTQMAWEESTALKNGWREGGGPYVPNPSVLPSGYSVKQPDGSLLGGIMDYIPGASNIRGAVRGDAGRAVLGPIDKALDDLGADLGGIIPTVDTSGLDRFNQPGGAGGVGGQYGGYQTRDVPMIEQRGPVDVERIDPAVIAEIERINARRMEAAQTGDVERAQIAEIDPTVRAEAERIRAAQMDPAARAEFERIQAARIDPAAMADAAQIRREEQAAMRARQLEVLSQLDAAARGEAPSVAQLMLKRQTEENIAQQRGLAAQARGSMIGLAAMNAASNVGILNQRAALDQAILRAQEMATARGQLGDATNQIRGQDIGLETSQAGLLQQTALANQAATNTRAGQQAQLQQQAATANQSTAAQTSQFNAGQINARSAQQAQLDQDAAKSNQAAALQVSLANAQAENARATRQAELAQQAYLADSSAENARRLEQARLEQAAAAENLRAATQADVANQNAYNTRATNQAQLEQDANKTNAAATNQARQFDVTTATEIDKANQGATLTGRGLDDSLDASMRGDSLTRRGQDIDIEKTKIDAATKNNQTRAILAGGGLETLGALGGTLIKSSDERAKASIRVAEDDIQAFLDAMSAAESKSWKYKRPKDPRAGEGRHYGKMAQDLETSAVGKSFVREDSDGMKVIDVKDAIGPMLAALAQVNARLNKIEKRRR